MILALSTFLWIAVLMATATSAFRVMIGRGKDHDALSFSYTLVALVMLGFGFRWIVAPDSMMLLDIMRIFSIALAMFLIYITRFYKKWG